MLTLVRGLLALALLAIPLLVIATLPGLFDLANKLPSTSQPSPVPTAFRLPDPTATTRTRSVDLEPAPPPTLAAPPPLTPTVRPTPTGEQVIVANTGGIGAVLRTEPITGRQVAALREQQLLTVLERRTVGSAEWLRVRTPDGQEGWVTALVARPAPASAPPARP